jgi:N-acetylneuraminic acid mutarotase
MKNKPFFGNCRLLAGVCLTGLLLTACESSDDDTLAGNWIRLSDLDGHARSDAVGFSIGGKGYIGTGYDGDTRLTDFWEYDPAKNSWTRKADFPGVARNGAVGFGTDTKGYIGTGFDGKDKLNDFWEYDPTEDKWTRKADFPGTARYGAIAMAINNMGYLGTGYDGNYTKDFWQYDPQGDTWTQKTSIGGSKRKDATCFVISGKGYIVTGIDNGTYENDLWEYDPTGDTWTKKRQIANISDESYDNDYTSIVGVSKVGLTINGKGYVATGGQSIGVKVWEYNPVTDLWKERHDFEGSSRGDAIGFSLGNTGYLTTGKSGSYYFDDLYSFTPTATYDEDDK